MSLQESHRTISFPLNSSVNIPRRLAEYKRGERTLFVAITKAAYISVGSIGAEFVYMFEDGVSVGDALATLVRKYGLAKENELTAILNDLLVQIETRQFYQSAVARDDGSDRLTMLARLTNRCNLRCTHCIVSSSPEWPINGNLSTAGWCDILDSYAAFISDRGLRDPRVTLTGGEALSRRDALEIAQHSKAKGIRTELFTNGVLIVNSRMASAIAASTDEIQISFDGATAEVHDRIRGAGMFARTVRAARLLAEAGASFRIAVVVMPQNYEDLMANLSSLVRDLGSRLKVRLGLAVEEGRAVGMNMRFATPEEGDRRLRTLVERLSEEKSRVQKPVIPNLKASSCGYAKEITINSDGVTFGCGPQIYPIGDLKTESFYDVADRTLGKSHRAHVDSVEGCRDCNIRYVCGGTCRIANTSTTGRSDISYCDLANKETNINRLFGYSTQIVPLAVLASNTTRRSL